MGQRKRELNSGARTTGFLFRSAGIFTAPAAFSIAVIIVSVSVSKATVVDAELVEKGRHYIDMAECRLRRNFDGREIQCPGAVRAASEGDRHFLDAQTYLVFFRHVSSVDDVGGQPAQELAQVTLRQAPLEHENRLSSDILEGQDDIFLVLAGEIRRVMKHTVASTERNEVGAEFAFNCIVMIADRDVTCRF